MRIGFLPVLFGALALVVLAAPGSATVDFYDEPPLLQAPSVNPVTTLVQSALTDPGPGIAGGVALAETASGGFVLARGPVISRHDANGNLAWSRSHTNVEQTVVVGEQVQTRYYEDWGDGSAEPIPQGSTLDVGEQVGPFAQHAVVDRDGNTYVNCLDTLHRDRSLVVKFDAAGTVLWRQVTSAPYATGAGFTWDSKVLRMELTPDEQTLAVLETLRTGSATHTRTRLVLFDASPVVTDRNGVVVRSIQFGQAVGAESFSHHAVGVGLGVTDDGGIVFATHDGPEAADPEAAGSAPSSLVLRRLDPPYATSPIVSSSRASARAQDEWNDLAVGPDGNVYLAGTRLLAGGESDQMALSADGATLAERWLTVAPAFVASGNPFNAHLAAGSRAYVDASGVTLVAERSDFRTAGTASNAAEGRLALARLGLDGSVKWRRHQTRSFIDRTFADGDGNVYQIGLPWASSGGSYSLWKHSAAGDLQFVVEFSPAAGRRFDPWRAAGLVDSSGRMLSAVADGSSTVLSSPDLGLTVLGLGNPAVVVRPGAPAGSPAGVKIDSVDVASQPGRFPFSFDIHLTGFGGSGPAELQYRAAVDGKRSGWTPAYPDGGVLHFDLDCHYFSVALRVKEAAGTISPAASFVANRVGNSNRFVVVIRNPPRAPTGLTARVEGGAAVLTWGDASDDETQFIVQRQTRQRNGAYPPRWKLLGKAPANATTFTDRTAKTGKTYRWRVLSKSRGGGAPSAVAELTIE